MDFHNWGMQLGLLTQWLLDPKVAHTPVMDFHNWVYNFDFRSQVQCILFLDAVAGSVVDPII